LVVYVIKRQGIQQDRSARDAQKTKEPQKMKEDEDEDEEVALALDQHGAELRPLVSSSRRLGEWAAAISAQRGGASSARARTPDHWRRHLGEDGAAGTFPC